MLQDCSLCHCTSGILWILLNFQNVYVSSFRFLHKLLFKELDWFKTISGEHVADFIFQVEKLYSKLIKSNIVLPEAVKAILHEI